MGYFYPGNILLYLTSPLMSLKWVSGDDMGDFTVLIEQHVDDEIEFSHSGLFHQVFMDWVSLENPRPGTRVFNHLVAVVSIG